MPRKLHDCPQCGTPTHGALCLSCAKANRIKHPDKQTYHRFWQTKKKYNIDEIDFEALWIAFRGRCGICDKLLQRPEQRRGQSLDVVAIDHNHQTGNVRGLLCNACNKGLGLFREDASLLERAKRYLQSCEN